MESSPDGDANTTSRRTSRRVVKKPDFYAASSPTGSAKRKRAEQDDGDSEILEDTSEDDVDESEDEPDEEELRERRRKQRQRKKTQSKPATKKPKTNGETVSLALRPAASKSRRPKKARPLQDPSAEDAGGLYADVFARGHTLDAVTAEWLSRFKENGNDAVADVVNFVLKCSGCDIKVTHYDIEDPDSCSARLTDIQDEYQAQNISDYPLISGGRRAHAFKDTVMGFFDSLMRAVAKSGILYEEGHLVIEHIAIWITTLSSAANRPFRHTATLACLAITSGLASVASELAESTAKTQKQYDMERKKPARSMNKERAASLRASIQQAMKKKGFLDETLKDWFHTIFIHRYKDVDYRVRVDCVQALGYWIMAYPDLFFEGSYLRYLGWVLSDASGHVRLEVVRQLQNIFNSPDKLAGLKTFTERYRARLVEIAARDSDTHVRTECIVLLDLLRQAGLLEPDDIDSVGRLIYDSDPRVRRSVVGFFSENINDVFESKLEDLGGQDVLDEVLVTTEDDDDYDSLRIEWLRLKAIGEVLQSYDEDDPALPNIMERGPGGTGYALIAEGVESRFSLITQALYDKIPVIREWEVLAGYLLFDHSELTQNGALDDTEVLFKQECKLTEREEIILLEILVTAVRIKLTRSLEAIGDKKVKKTKVQKQELAEEQDRAARHLAQLIPRLLKKFTASPDALSAVLRLEHVLNLEVFQELRQDTTTYADFLDVINKQFLTHGSESVVVEASAALCHAKGYAELEEVTEEKLQALWDDTMNTFHTLVRGRNLSSRGSLSENVLTLLKNAVLRIQHLSKISDCREPLNSVPSFPRKGKQSRAQAQNAKPAIDLLIELMHRGIPGPDGDPAVEALENSLIKHTLETILFYLLWTINAWRSLISKGTSIPNDELEAIVDKRDDLVRILTNVMGSRKGADELRIDVTGQLLDIYCLFGTLHMMKKQVGSAAKNVDETYTALALEMDLPSQHEVVKVLDAAETAYAKIAKKTLDTSPADDDDPVSSDDDLDSDSEEDEDEESEAAREAKAKIMLASEQRLCHLASKIVMALIGGVLDGDEPGQVMSRQNVPKKRLQTGIVRKRLERNKLRLGPNYKAVVEFLDENKAPASKPKKTQATKAKADKANDGKKSVKSDAMVIDEEDEEHDERRVDDEEDSPEHLREKELVEDGGHEVEQEEEREPERAQSEEMESILGD